MFAAHLTDAIMIDDLYKCKFECHAFVLCLLGALSGQLRFYLLILIWDEPD